MIVFVMQHIHIDIYNNRDKQIIRNKRITGDKQTIGNK